MLHGGKNMPDYTQDFTNIPYGPLGIVALPGCEELAEKIDRYIVKWRAIVFIFKTCK